MNVNEMRVMADFIKILQSRGITVLLVEHNVKTVMNLCENYRI